MLKQNPPDVQIADFTKLFVLLCDASFPCTGACLMQENNHNDILPVAYYFKKFNEAQLSGPGKPYLLCVKLVNLVHTFLRNQQRQEDEFCALIVELINYTLIQGFVKKKFCCLATMFFLFSFFLQNIIVHTVFFFKK